MADMESKLNKIAGLFEGLVDGIGAQLTHIVDPPINDRLSEVEVQMEERMNNCHDRTTRK